MVELLLPHVGARPDDAAIVDDRGIQTWRETNERANRTMHALNRLGCGPGDRITLMARNSREWWEVTLAAIHGGIVCVPANWHWQHEELAYTLTDSSSRVLVVSIEFLPVAQRACDILGEHAPHVVVIGGSAAAGRADALGFESILASSPPSEPELAYGTRPMMYTSGTTGRPKGVLHDSGLSTAAVFRSGAEQFLELMAMTPTTTSLIAGPAYHSAQWSFALLPFVTGSTLITPAAAPAQAILQLIDEHAVGNVHLVPTQFVRLLRLPERVRASFAGSSLAVVAHGGAPCPTAVKQSMIDWWGPRVTEYYGGTETGMATVITASEWLNHQGSVGRSLPAVDLQIRDGNGTTVSDGVTGTIWVRWPGKDFEYHNAPEKTRTAHDRDGYATTGDMGYLRDGYLYISDRATDMIISGGVNIYPAEIENVMHDHPRVVDVAVVGGPDHEFGEAVVAYVIADDAAGPDLVSELQSYCRTRLSGFKCPRVIHLVEDLPRSNAGKLLKRDLREALWPQDAPRA